MNRERKLNTFEKFVLMTLLLSVSENQLIDLYLINKQNYFAANNTNTEPMHFKNSLNQFSQNDLQTLNALKFIQQNQQNAPQTQQFYPQQQPQHLANHSSNGVMAQTQRHILGLNQLLQPDCNSNHLKNWQNIGMGNNINDTHLDRAARFHRSSAALCKPFSNCAYFFPRIVETH